MAESKDKAAGSGYTEPRPEQKSGEGKDLGQEQTETLREVEWNKRKGSQADPDADTETERNERAAERADK